MHKRHGFTIVELLIVIVVIGILAAITIVAFNGMQARAQNSTATSNVSGMTRALEAFRAGGGTTLRANTVNKDRLCLGDPSEYPAVSGLAAGRCRSDDGALRTYVADAFFTQDLSTVARARGATPTVTDSAGVIYRGMWYDDNNDTQPSIKYVLKGTGQSCSLEGAVGTNVNGTTHCTLPINISIQYCVPGDSSCD